MSASALFLLALIMVIGICDFGSSFVSDIKENLRTLDLAIVSSKKRKLSSQEWTNISKDFTAIIQFHSESKEYCVFLFCFIFIKSKKYSLFRFADRFSDTNNGIIFAYLLYMLLSVCGLLLQINIVSFTNAYQN